MSSFKIQSHTLMELTVQNHFTSWRCSMNRFCFLNVSPPHPLPSYFLNSIIWFKIFQIYISVSPSILFGFFIGMYRSNAEYGCWTKTFLNRWIIIKFDKFSGPVHWHVLSMSLTGHYFHQKLIFCNNRNKQDTFTVTPFLWNEKGSVHS